jgi:hypothetical protein
MLSTTRCLTPNTIDLFPVSGQYKLARTVFVLVHFVFAVTKTACIIAIEYGTSPSVHFTVATPSLGNGQVVILTTRNAVNLEVGFRELNKLERIFLVSLNLISLVASLAGLTPRMPHCPSSFLPHA